MQEFGDMIHGSSPVDRFVFMLQERLDNSEDKIERLEGCVRSALDMCIRSDRMIQDVLVRSIVHSYRANVALSTYVMSDDYYLKTLGHSLSIWAETVGFVPIDGASTAGDVLQYMKGFAPCGVQHARDAALMAGRFLIRMSVADLERFQVWDTVPDLVDDDEYDHE